MKISGIKLLKKKPKENFYDGLILAVNHSKIINLGINKIKSFGKKKFVLFDVKGALDKGASDLRL